MWTSDRALRQENYKILNSSFFFAVRVIKSGGLSCQNMENVSGESRNK